MRDVLTLPRNAVPRLLAAIVRQGREGSRDPRILRVTGEAVRRAEDELERVGSPFEQFTRAYTLALARFRFAEDAVGDETVQAPGFTWDRGAGDCDDAAALVVALARSLGLRSRVVLGSRYMDGALTALHVYAEVEGPGGWLPADLGGYLGLGEPVPAAVGTVRHAVDVDAPGAPVGVGFLDALLGGVFGWLGAQETSRAAERTAEATLASADRQAAANVRAAQLQADAYRAAAEQERLAVEHQAAATLDVARVQALVRAGELRTSSANLASVLDAARRLTVPLTLLGLALALSPVLANITKPVPRARVTTTNVPPSPVGSRRAPARTKGRAR